MQPQETTLISALKYRESCKPAATDVVRILSTELLAHSYASKKTK
jgi:hypothetical protein